MRFVLYLRFILVIVLCGGLLTSVEAVSLQSGEYFIWGISTDDVQIPAGSVITEAVLTIENPSTTDLYVHLLDNPDAGSTISQDNGVGNIFDGYGVGLQGQLENGNLVFRFSQINDPDSDVWNVFESPFNFPLADGSTVTYSSALLKLIDFAGTGRSFGIGIDSDSGVALDGITLTTTVNAFTDQGMNYSESSAIDLNNDLILGSMKPDFNGDGKTGLLWRDRSTGAYKAVIMDGLVKVEEASLGGTYDGLKIVGLCDFNGDGKSDVLWRNSVTGNYSAAVMDGLVETQRGNLGGNIANWQIVGLADFNGDGKSDLVWRHAVTGGYSASIMDGLIKLQDQGLGGNITNWQIVDLADFNGDGKSDLLWRHTVTGGHSATIMDGLVKVQDQGLGGNIANWQIIDLADFNGDGKSDLVWRHIVTGGHFATLMDGLVKVQDQGLGGNIANWQIVDLADFNGDGKSDLVWRHAVTGVHFSTLMDGLVKVDDSFLVGDNQDWLLY